MTIRKDCDEATNDLLAVVPLVTIFVVRFRPMYTIAVRSGWETDMVFIRSISS